MSELDLRIIKNILNNLSLSSEFAARSFPERLFTEEYQEFTKIVFDYTKTYRNLPSPRILLENSSDTTQTKQILNDLEKTTASPNEYKYDLDILKQRFTAKKIRELREVPWQDENPEEAIKFIQKELEVIRQVNSNKKQAFIQQTLKDYMPEFKENYKEKFNNPELGRGKTTGYSYLDYITGGLYKQELILISGETSAGKSLVLNNLGINLWLGNNTLDTEPKDLTPGCNVMYFSLEMPYAACARRTLARLADVPIYGLRDAKLNKFQVDRLSKADKFIKNYPYHFEIVDIARGVSVETVEERFNAALQNYTPDVVIIDYLTLMEDDEMNGVDSSDWLKLGYLAGKLHEFARINNCICITASQMNRPSKGGKEETMTINRIGRSSLILHHANIGLFIESRKDERNFSDLKLHLLKNRDGALGTFSLEKRFANAAILDIPFTPDDFAPEENIDTDDISKLMEKYHWGSNLKKNDDN